MGQLFVFQPKTTKGISSQGNSNKGLVISHNIVCAKHANIWKNILELNISRGFTVIVSVVEE